MGKNDRSESIKTNGSLGAGVVANLKIGSLRMNGAYISATDGLGPSGKK